MELKFSDGNMIAINCATVENEVADDMYQRSGLDDLIYPDPFGVCWPRIKYTGIGLEIHGRMPNAAVDSAFVYLSNIEDGCFDRACKAAGFKRLYR